MQIVSEGMLASQQCRSNLDQKWLRGIGLVAEGFARITTPSVKSGSRLDERYGMVPEGVLESQQSRSNLDQDWLRGMGIVAEGMLESQQSRSNLDQDWNHKTFGQIWIKTG